MGECTFYECKVHALRRPVTTNNSKNVFCAQMVVILYPVVSAQDHVGVAGSPCGSNRIEQGTTKTLTT